MIAIVAIVVWVFTLWTIRPKDSGTERKDTINCTAKPKSSTPATLGMPGVNPLEPKHPRYPSMLYHPSLTSSYEHH